MEPPILFARFDHGGAACAALTLNRPEKGNALNRAMLEDLESIAGRIAADREIRAVVLRGRGRFFSTGGDIEAWGSLTPEQMRDDWIPRGIQVFEKIARLPQPVIAVLHGHALGGGLELALSADLRVALSGAKLGAPEVSLNMVSGWMGISRLAEIAGVARARHLTLLGSPITAAQALEWGLVTALAADSDALEWQVQDWLDHLCANGPQSMRLTKEILESLHRDLREQHARAAAAALATRDGQEGVRAFLEKRKPVYRND
jgi:enoyl-CoA hydratase/carnithine racemase